MNDGILCTRIVSITEVCYYLASMKKFLLELYFLFMICKVQTLKSIIWRKKFDINKYREYHLVWWTAMR